MSEVEMALAAMVTFAAKHFVADFMLQTSWIAANKGRYGHIAGVLHALGHILLTPLVFLVLAPPSLVFAAALTGAEFVWHYHQDWLKDRLSNAFSFTPSDTGFWWALGLDQALHQLTYVAFIYVLLRPEFVASCFG